MTYEEFMLNEEMQALKYKDKEKYIKLRDKLYHAQWYKDNKAHERQRQTEYYKNMSEEEKNRLKEKNYAYSKEYRKSNSDKIKKHNEKYRKEHKEYFKIKSHEQYLRSKGIEYEAYSLKNTKEQNEEAIKTLYQSKERTSKRAVLQREREEKLQKITNKAINIQKQTVQCKTCKYAKFNQFWDKWGCTLCDGKLVEDKCIGKYAPKEHINHSQFYKL